MYTMKESVAVAKEADAKKGFSPTNTSIPRVRNEPERQLGSLRGVIDNIRRNGGKPSVESIATELSSMRAGERAPALLALQQTHGNRYVQRVVAGIQAKLVVGQPGDIYEQEADRVAEQVMRMPEPQVQRQAGEEKEEGLIQTKPIAGQVTPLVQRQVEEEQEEETIIMKPLVLEQTDGGFQIDPNLESRLTARQGGGRPLPDEVRSYMEPRFGADFSGVRVHTDSEAVQMSREIGAHAFTRGSDIYIGAGRYDPGNTSGKRLLAHELTHVVQQNGAEVQRKLTISQPDDNFEQKTASVVVQRRQQPITKAADAGLILRWEGERPTIRESTPEEIEQVQEMRRTFELQVLRIYALGPLLKIDFRIRQPGDPEWLDFHFFGTGAAAGVEFPIISRPSNVETHTTRNPMRVRDLMGGGRLISLGIPHTNVRRFQLFFTGGPAEAGFATVSWTLETGIRQPYALGVYVGRFEFGHSIAA